jgi:hypothetical protein
MSHFFVCSPDDSHIVPGAVARTTIQNLSSAYESHQRIDIRERVSNSVEDRKPHQFPIIRTRDRVVARVCRFRVRPAPYEYLVVVNLRVTSALERGRKVGVEL